MSSSALTRWRTIRREHLDELLLAHNAVRGGEQRRGRQWRTQQVNNALMIRLATEFQGFARELHDLSADTFADWAASGNLPLRLTLRTRLTEGRKLDMGNANPGSLGSDFGRLGLSLWPSIKAMDPGADKEQEQLENLNTLRNALAHDDEGKLAALSADGNPATLKAFKGAYRSIDSLAGTLDTTVADHLSQLFGQPRPW